MGANILGPLVKAAIDAYIAGLAGPADIDRDDLFEVMWDEVEDWVGEYGTNADGSYLIINIGGVRVQVCWGSHANAPHDYSAVGNGYYSPSIGHDFARAFASTPLCKVWVAHQNLWASGQANSASSYHCRHQFWTALTGRTDATNYIAIGLAS